MIGFVTTILILLCLFIIFLVLMQRTSGGMGSAMGGGAADQVLGAGSQSQLTKMTVWSVLTFFAFAFVLYALYQNQSEEREGPVRGGKSGDAGVSGEISPTTFGESVKDGNSTALSRSDLNASNLPAEKNATVPAERPEANGTVPAPPVPAPPEDNASGEGNASGERNASGVPGSGGNRGSD